MKVYIVRHGQSTTNALKCHGSINEDLTKLGIEQAEKLGEEIKDIDYDIIISSPLIRAKHTAEIINRNNVEIMNVK